MSSAEKSLGTFVLTAGYPRFTRVVLGRLNRLTLSTDREEIAQTCAYLQGALMAASHLGVIDRASLKEARKTVLAGTHERLLALGIQPLTPVEKAQVH